MWFIFQKSKQGKFISEDIFTPINPQTIWTTETLCFVGPVSVEWIFGACLNWATIMQIYNCKFCNSLHNFMTLPSLTKFTDFSSLKHLLRLCFVKTLLIMRHETSQQLVSHRIFATSLKENKNSWSTHIFIILISSVLPIQQQLSVQI